MRPPRFKFWPHVFLILAVFLVYANVYGNSFLYDDEFLIQKNANILGWSGIWKAFLMSSTGGAGAVDSFYRPLQIVLYTLVYQIFGYSTFGFHFLNLILHATNAVLIFALAEKFGFERAVAFFGALLWALHPIHTEAVTYQSATADPLYAVFLLAGLLALFRREREGWREVALGAAFYILGLLSKETAIVFPALVIACLFFLRKERWKIKTYLVTFPFWVIAGLYLIARKTVLNFHNTFQFYKTANIYTEHILYRIDTSLATLPSYLGLLVWPRNLHMDRGFPIFVNFTSWQVLLGAAIVLLGLFALWAERKKERPIWSFAFLWFIAADVPHTGILVPVNSIFLEHWMYLPSVALFVCVVESLSRSKVHAVGKGSGIDIARAAPLGLVAIVLGTLTFKQNEIWETPISFYTHILKFEPKVARVENNLAMAYSDQGDDIEAISHYRKAIAISDDYPQTHHNLALALIRQGKIDEAIEQLQDALRIDPDFYHSSNVLAQIYHQMGDQAKAEEYSKRYAASARKFQH